MRAVQETTFQTMSSASPRVVAIVLNWCAESDTAACLESLAAQTYPALTTLLMDNASPDGSGDRLHGRFPELPYLQTGANLGYAGGNNRGFEWALANGADYVLVLNDDTVVDPDCVTRLVDAARETGAAVTAPQILYFDEPELVWYGGGRLSIGRGMGYHLRENTPIDPAQQREDVTFVCGCCFLMRADVLRTVGGFEESFFAYAEDTELSLRLQRLGHRMIYEPSARVLHRIKRSAKETPFQIRQRDRNRRSMVGIHYGVWDRIRFAAWFYPTRAVHLARYVASGNWPNARAILSGALSRVPVRAEAASRE